MIGKCRGKSITGNQWVYGYYVKRRITCGIVSHLIYTDVLNKDRIEFYAVDPKTVGLFTGKQDNNGKDVYLGQKLKLKTGTIVVVCWNKDTAGFALRLAEDKEPYCGHLLGEDLGEIIEE